METIVPSTVSTVGLANRGSISWTVKVPSELRIASMLAPWPVERHEETLPCVGVVQRV